MRYLIPDYIKEFHCTASACEATCCAGWQIVIDEKSLKKYKKLRTPFGSRLKNSIDWKESSFHQYGRRCAFLNEENLCDIYIEAGEDYLCRTCTQYPRHIEEFEGIREMSLSLSCPEAAKLLLRKKEPVRFLHKDTKREESYPDFDYFLYSVLGDARELIIGIMQNRKLDMGIRMGMCLALGHDLQKRIGRGQIFACEEVLEKYQKPSASAFFIKRLEKIKNEGKGSFDQSRQILGLLGELEVLQKEWPAFLGDIRKQLYTKGQERYQQIRREFLNWMFGKRNPLIDWAVQCEQLMVYFVFTYFCGAVYDGQADAKVRMAACSVLLIQEILMGRWLEKGEWLEFSDLVEIVYRFSRELEHSDLNLGRMEELVKNNSALEEEAVMGCMQRVEL